MRPTKILHIISKLHVGGVENQLLTVLGKYDRNTLSPLVCTLADKGAIGRDIEAMGIEVFSLNKLKHRFDWTIVRDIKNLIGENDIKIVRTHQYHANLYGRLAAKKTKVPCVVASVHNVYTRDRKIHRRVINRYLVRYTDKVVAVSEEVKKHIIKYDGLSEEKVKVIHNGVDVKRFSDANGKRIRSELRISPEVPIVGTIGRLTYQKGQRYLIDALATLKYKFPQLILLIVGDGPLRNELEDYADSLGTGKNVRFLGTRRDIPDLLSAMDIFVLPSLWEGLVNALLEAMAAGNAVIATDIPPIREIIDTDNIGILVPTENSSSIVASIDLLLHNRLLEKDYGKSAKERARSIFNIDTTVNKYTELFEDILGNKGLTI